MTFTKYNKPGKPKSWQFRVKRLHVVQFFLGVAIFALVARLSFLQIFNKDFLNAQGNARILRTVTIPSYRGLVTDRRGSPIAVSTPVDSIWVNPKHFHATQSQLTQLSSLLALPPHDIVTKIKQYSHRSFLYLKRALTPEHAAKIEKLNIPGIYTQREFRRYYPAGPVTAQLLGFTNIDDEGQAGIELAFDQWLKPIPGKKRVLEDRMGHWIQDVDHSLVPRQGGNLALSIDLRIQTLAYNALNEALKRLNAKSATLVMLDIVSGEVLAMVSVPSFNPNVYHERTSKGVRNKALTDQIEPGSTAKALSMVSLLEHSPFSIDDEVDTNPGFYRLGGHLIRDVRNFGKLTLSQVLVKSSNIGLSKFIIQRPSEELLNTFKSFGLGTDITNFFPGENSGRLPSPTKSPIVTATWSFGYGFTATPLQLVHAYATLASRGKKQPISLLKLEDTIPKGDQIISSETAEHVIRMLTEVLNTSGTGRRASIKGYKTAGKTGTTRLVGSSGYDADRHNALFIGFTPVDEPRLATLVLIEEPDESNDHYYGGFAAAPVYAQVVRSALHMLNVPPDNA